MAIESGMAGNMSIYVHAQHTARSTLNTCGSRKLPFGPFATQQAKTEGDEELFNCVIILIDIRPMRAYCVQLNMNESSADCGAAAIVVVYVVVSLMISCTTRSVLCL